MHNTMNITKSVIYNCIIISPMIVTSDPYRWKRLRLLMVWWWVSIRAKKNKKNSRQQGKTKCVCHVSVMNPFCNSSINTEVTDVLQLVKNEKSYSIISELNVRILNMYNVIKFLCTFITFLLSATTVIKLYWYWEEILYCVFTCQTEVLSDVTTDRTFCWPRHQVL